MQAHSRTPHPAPLSTALRLGLVGVLILAAGASTGCASSQHRGALIGAAVGAGVGLILASESYSHPRSRLAYRSNYDDRRVDPRSRRSSKSCDLY